MKLEYKYGLGIGAGIAAWVLAEFALGFHTTRIAIGEISGYFSVIIPIVLIYQALSRIRHDEGSLPNKRALGAGFKISLVAAACIAIFFYVYSTYLNPDWFNIALDYQRKKLLDEGISAQEVLDQLEALRPIYSTTLQVITSFVGTLLQGVFIAYVLGFIVRRKKA